MTCPTCQAFNPANSKFCRQCRHAFGKGYGGLLSEIAPIIAWVLVGGLLMWWAFSPKATLIASARPTATPTPVEAEPTGEPPELGGEPPVDIQGRNGHGEVVDFRVRTLYKDFPWVAMSDTEIQNLGKVREFGEGRCVFSKELQRDIKNAPELISVGTADVRPGDDGISEESRSSNRSNNLGWLLSEIRTGRESDDTVFTWNLGRWTGPRSTAYEDQRRVIIIEVIRPNKNTEFKSALRNALERERNAHPIFGQLLDYYSKSKDMDIR